MWPIAFEKVGFEEALDFFRDKLSITKDDWLALTEAARQKAFTVAGVAQLDLIADVWKALDKAIDEGTTLADFKKDIGARLEGAWKGTVENPAWRMETIFRTNVQSAYAAGRYAQATDPEVLGDRPYWLFDAVLDTRTTDVCRLCDGTILPADDPWWKNHLPPLHFNCRSTIITLSAEQAGEMGVSVTKPKADPDEGFGAPPADDPDGAPWAPTPSDYPKDLWDAFEDKEP